MGSDHDDLDVGVEHADFPCRAHAVLFRIQSAVNEYQGEGGTGFRGCTDRFNRLPTLAAEGYIECIVRCWGREEFFVEFTNVLFVVNC